MYPQLEVVSKKVDLGAGEARAYCLVPLHCGGCDRGGACAIGQHRRARETGHLQVRHPRRRIGQPSGQDHCMRPSTPDESESVYV